MTIKAVDIGANEAAGTSGCMDEEKIWTYDSAEDKFKPTSDNWIWETNGKYSVIELPWEVNGYSFSDVQRSSVNKYTFTQNTESNVLLRVTNVWEKTGNLSLEKHVNGPSHDPNRGFTFTIHLQDGRHPVSGTYNYIGTNIRNGSLTFDDNGNAEIQYEFLK